MSIIKSKSKLKLHNQEIIKNLFQYKGNRQITHYVGLMVVLHVLLYIRTPNATDASAKRIIHSAEQSLGVILNSKLNC